MPDSGDSCNEFIEAKMLAQTCAPLDRVALSTKFGTVCRARNRLCLRRPLLFADTSSSFG